MTPRVRRSIASVLALVVISLPGAVRARERRGADVVVIRKNRIQVSGELIAVKQDSLLLLNRVAQDVSIKFVDVSAIRVFKKSHASTGFLIGFLVGGAAGAAWGYSRNSGDPGDQKMAAGAGVLLFGGLAGVLGVAIGEAAGRDETIIFDGLSESEAKKAKSRLRSMAKVPTAQ